MDSFFLKVEKRVRFVISTLILTFLMLFSTFFFFENAWIFIPVFILASYGLTYFSIVEDIEKSEWITLFLTPVFFTVSFYLFYFLFPVRWLTRIPFIGLYAVSVYATLLTSNIFNVGVEKSLQLYRAAFSVNYFYHTVIIFLISNILFSFKENFLINGLATGVVMFPISLQLLWTVKLTQNIEKEIMIHAFFISLVLAEIAILISFLPLQTTVLALILAATYYSLGGLTNAYLDNRLFIQTVREYIFVLGFVIIIALLTLSW